MSDSKGSKKLPKKVESEWNEVWVDTTFHTKNNRYHISNYGRIKSITKATGDEHLIKGARCGKQKFLNVIQPDGSRGYCFVSRFVAEHFVEQPSPEHNMIAFLDEDFENCKWVNLKWVTKDEWHAWNQQTQGFLKGREKLKKIYKLNITQVRLIKKRLKEGKVKRKTLAKQFGVSLRTISRISVADTWAGQKIEDN